MTNPVENLINPIFDSVRDTAGNLIDGLLPPKSSVPTRINSMVANIAAHKLTYPHKYEIAFTNMGPIENLRLCVSCESCIMPGKTIATQEIKFHGPVYEMPYEESFAGDMEAVFKLSGDYYERNKFQQWQDMIINPKTHNLGYLDSYSKDIEITQLDLKDNPIMRIVLEDAYPKTIGPIQFGDEQTNQVNKQPISFSYRKWRIKTPDEVGFLEGLIDRLDLVGRIDGWLQGITEDSPFPMIPTAIGGHVISLPWGLDPGQVTQQGQDILGNWLNDTLGDII